METIQQSLLLQLSKEKGGENDTSSPPSAVQHFQDCVLKMTGLSQLSDVTSHCTKLRQKITLLPRLAESLSSRIALKEEGCGTTTSENDWDVYLQTLLDQGKKVEALETLKTIQCTPMIVANDDTNGNDNTTTNKNNNVLPQINDEHTIENHMGSLLPYTQRKKLERCAVLCQELGMFTDATGYYRELLNVFPDQWTYWMGLVDSCVKKMGTSSPSSSSLSLSGDDGNTMGEEEGFNINEEGWEQCQTFAKEVISKVESSHKYALRGPHLILLELASMKVLRQAAMRNEKGEEDEELVLVLRDEICKYGNKFGSIASCCFADIQSYLNILVRASSSSSPAIMVGGCIPNNVLHVLNWAKEMWSTNAQSSTNAADHNLMDEEVSNDEFRERRKKIRSFIFAVHVVYGIAVEMKDSTLKVLETYAPSVSQMVIEWRASLASLPGVAPKDGGQKEVLPGDEIILLTSQLLQFQATKNKSSTLLLQAAGLLEEAMDHSPYNPHLKIAAIGVYTQLNAAYRALSIYQDLGVKQIQLDSCSYLILPTLIQGGLYTSAIKLSASILRLHGSTSKEVKDYASKALINGLMFKAKEMVTFQREKMRPSLQLLYSKSLIMDAAALMIQSDLGNDIVGGSKQRGKGEVRLAEEKGFCGSEEDLTRAEQLAIDAEIHFNAPSIIHASSQSNSIDDFVSSDNRDMTINYFEILHKNTHLTQKEMVVQSLRSGYMHGLLTRTIVAVRAANAPKKGKIPKLIDETAYHCQSIRHCLSNANKFGQEVDMDDVDLAMWNACCQLCKAIVSVIQGNNNDSVSDTLAEREKAATSIVDSTKHLVENARKSFSLYCTNSNSLRGVRVCQLLPDNIIPFYTLLETTARLFALFGWGKRKRLTKAASGSLANLALSFREFISDMLQAMPQFRSFGKSDGGDVTMEPLVESAISSEVVGSDVIQRVIKEVVASRDMTNDRVDPFLIQMKESLDTYNKE